eukprot:Partr_v1_DN26914_c3_g1_i1_m7173 putative PHOsphatase
MPNTTPTSQARQDRIHIYPKDTLEAHKAHKNLISGTQPRHASSSSIINSKAQVTTKSIGGVVSAVHSDDAMGDAFSAMVEFIPGQLYFDCRDNGVYIAPRNASVIYTDTEFSYVRFYLDFGPPNMAQIIKFWKMLHQRLEICRKEKRVLVCISSNTPDKSTNATLLMTLAVMIELNLEPERALAPIRDSQRTANLVMAPYRDAGYGNATYWIDIEDCVHAFHSGVRELKLLDVETFDTEAYEFHERVENGDLGWVIPGYFLALATPRDEPLPHLVRYHEDVKAGLMAPLRPTPPGLQPLHEVKALASHLRTKMGVEGIIRLNNKLYDRQTFLDADIKHYELYFPDGSVPPWDTIVKKFMLICDTHLPTFPPSSTGKKSDAGVGPLAVHCKAGLGRTGSLICCWMIKTFGWSAKKCISWCRLMRPGSVVGPQQNWLETVEPHLHRWRKEDMAKKSKAHAEHLTREMADAMGMNRNDGSEDIASTTMGMNVPAQPRKLEIDRASIPAGEQDEMAWSPLPQDSPRPYNLRSQEGGKRPSTDMQ